MYKAFTTFKLENMKKKLILSDGVDVHLCLRIAEF